jgi:hypothetical protein
METNDDAPFMRVMGTGRQMERGAPVVGHLVQEAAGPGVALHEAVGMRVEDLTPLTQSTVTTPGTSWGIRCHLTSPPSMSMNPSKVDDVHTTVIVCQLAEVPHP